MFDNIAIGIAVLSWINAFVMCTKPFRVRNDTALTGVCFIYGMIMIFAVSYLLHIRSNVQDITIDPNFVRIVVISTGVLLNAAAVMEFIDYFKKSDFQISNKKMSK